MYNHRLPGLSQIVFIIHHLSSVEICVICGALLYTLLILFYLCLHNFTDVHAWLAFERFL